MESNNSKSYILNVMLMALILLVSRTVYSVEKVTYYHNDHLGSPVAATDSGGNVVWRESYQPFGTREQHQGDTRNTLWFTGKQEENFLGLIYFGARWYDPEMGRFLAMDPVGVSSGNPHSFNRYTYANNNPYTFIDPDGRDAVDDKLLTYNVLFGMQTSLKNAQSPMWHEEGANIKDDFVYHAPRGSTAKIIVPYRTPSGEVPDAKYHVHPPYGTPIPEKPGRMTADPHIPSWNDKELAGMFPGRSYIVTNEGEILRFDRTGVKENLGTIQNRLEAVTTKRNKWSDGTDVN